MVRLDGSGLEEVSSIVGSGREALNDGRESITLLGGSVGGERDEGGGVEGGDVITAEEGVSRGVARKNFREGLKLEGVKIHFK